jgi:alpha-L-rhamnosidase
MIMPDPWGFGVGLGFLLVGAAVGRVRDRRHPLPPDRLRCEYLINPLGVDVRRPRFFWVPRSERREERQSAYRIVVAASPNDSRNVLWDSGKVKSGRFTQVEYEGRALASGTTYYWKVRWWDRDGASSPWSDPGTFDTGFFERADWKGRWIGGANQLRREFEIDGEIRRARAYVCGLGYHELRINGRKAGSSVLDPAWTSTDKRVLYTVHDIGLLLRPGANAAGVLLGRGWYGDRVLLLQIEIETRRGRRITIVSDGSWKTKDGPIVADSIYDGETYDARKEDAGWDEPGCRRAGWAAAKFVEGPSGERSAQMMPPIRVVETLVPVRLCAPKPGMYVFDLGQIISGWARLQVSGPSGTPVRMRFAELLYPDGTINRENLRSARAEDLYILKGDGEEVYEPRFTYHGFRYVEVTGFPGVPTLESVRGRVVHSAVRQTGSFVSSNPVLNGLQRLIIWGQKTNLHGIPTDCGQRDERMGWLGDAQVTAEEAIFNFDMAAFYMNFLRDIRDVQDENGRIADTVPHVWGKRPADPAWGAAYPLLAWSMYQYYGDVRVLEDHYAGLKKYVDFLNGASEDGLVRFSHYGDWVAVDKTPGDIVSSFYHYENLRILAGISAVLGKSPEAQAYVEQAEAVKRAFQAAYFDPRTKGFANNTQTANALALFSDLAADETREAVWLNLFDDVVYRHDSHLTTGIIGTKIIMEVLTKCGNTDLAYDVAVRTSYPSWGYMIENGATTLWELWTKREGPSMNSHNHPMLGSVGSWLYKAVPIPRGPDSKK